jgi:hypothetical protein
MTFSIVTLSIRAFRKMDRSIITISTVTMSLMTINIMIFSIIIKMHI